MEEAASVLSVYVTALVLPDSSGTPAQGPAGTRPLGDGRGRTGRNRDRQARGRGDLRHRRQPGQAREAAGARRAGGLRFPQLRLVRRGDGGDRGRGGSTSSSTRWPATTSTCVCKRCVRPAGTARSARFDIYADNDLGLRVFRKNLRFAAIDIDRLMVDDPHLSHELSRTCLDLLDRGALPPFAGPPSFPTGDYSRALRLMTAGQHQGKLVLKAPQAAPGSEFPIADARPFFDPDATYLVTGGLGGFGLRLVSYLVASGARHLTLMDRDPERRRSVDWVRRSTALINMSEEAEIDIVPGDVSSEADVRRCVAQLRRPLKGVFHLAGTLDDRLLADTTRKSITAVFAPKARGALHLHRATAGHALDHFVLFSSIASSLGNFGQINYSAANAFADGLVAWRRQQGLPGLSYSFAALAEGRHGGPQSSPAAHDAGRRHPAGQRRLRHRQPGLRPALDAETGTT